MGKVKSSLNDNNIVKLNTERFYNTTWFRIAAMLFIVAGISWMLFFNQSSEMIALTANKNVVQDTLSDGSVITLNKHSKLQYASNFGQKSRVVKLNGEAYFQVKHNQEIPFVVETNGVFIKDIGTAFNVISRDDSSNVMVLVEEGEVFFYKDDGNGIYLEKGESASFNRSTGIIAKYKGGANNVTAYRDGVLNFNNTPMSEVVIAVSKLYGVNVIADEKIANCKLTVRFENESLETVLSIISETLGIETKHQDSSIVFFGNACN